MMTTDADRLADALRTATLPVGLGVPSERVLQHAHRARHRRAAARTAVSALSVASLTAAAVWGSGLFPGPQETVSPATASDEVVTDPDVSVDDVHDMTRQEQLAAHAENMGIENPPNVEVIREVSPQEATQIHKECLADKGWPSEANTYTMPVQEEAAFNLDIYRCLAAYPVNQGLQPSPNG